jgi:hypothetical protein
VGEAYNLRWRTTALHLDRCSCRYGNLGGPLGVV